MKTPFTKSKTGFTIIEVSLVLAIGGLIMLMVFIAWPAIQRNQKDTQRRTVDLPRLYSQLTQYQSNNSGALPQASNTTAKTTSVTGSETASSITSTDKWSQFYKNYMLAQGDTFVDPVGTPYSLKIVTCSNSGNFTKPNAGKTASTSTCDNGLTNGQLTTTFDAQQSVITIVIGASCNGETAYAATTGTGGTRKFAIMYRLQSGGVFCQSN